MPKDLTLSSTEAGLLTVAERRGQVVSAKTIDRTDPTAVERRDLLERLAQRGMLREASRSQDEVAYAITGQGRDALTILDLKRD